MDDEGWTRYGYVAGGRIGRDEVETAAVIALAGLPVEKFLELDSTFDVILWIRIAERVIEWRRKIDQNRATLIANAVWAAVK